jgi:hypothetical protein
MPDPLWYEVVATGSLAQGDVLPGCPVPCVEVASFPIVEGAQLDVPVRDLDLVVMSQSCDLENGKIEDVLLAEVVSYAEVKKSVEFLRSTNARRSIVQGNLTGYSLMQKADAPLPAMPWSLVDFHRLHVLRKTYVEGFAQQLGDRLRLVSPYREHLAQAFARYFMRVGLPHDAAEFISEGQ